MKHPKGFFFSDSEHLVCKLKKPIFWFLMITFYFQKMYIFVTYKIYDVEK